MFSHVLKESAYGVAVVAGDSFYGSDSIFLDNKFANSNDFVFRDVYGIKALVWFQ